jgi:hypothetical protein
MESRFGQLTFDIKKIKKKILGDHDHHGCVAHI